MENSPIQVKPEIVKPNDFWKTASRFILRSQSYFGLIGILILSAALSPVRNGHYIFLNPENLLNIVRFASENGIIAIGMTLVIIIGGIDLSVGAVLAISAVGAAALMMRNGWETVPTILTILSMGAFIGFINGIISTKLNIQAFIITLATLSASRGIASLWSGGYAIPLAFGQGAGVAPQSFKDMFAGSVNLLGLDIPVQVFYFIGVGLIISLVLKKTGFGRHIFAVGGNETASRLSGVAVHRTKIIVFALCGFLASLAALLHASLVNQGSHIDGSGYELNAIAAVVIGGTSMSGGAGTVLGTMIGALILSILDNILGLRNIQSEYQLILKGLLIVLAVMAQKRQSD
ncbi:MAG: ABC transporter permease [Leptolinea sp.]